jgi:hypothetical protein
VKGKVQTRINYRLLTTRLGSPKEQHWETLDEATAAKCWEAPNHRKKATFNEIETTIETPAAVNKQEPVRFIT